MRHFILFVAFILVFLKTYSQKSDSVSLYCKEWRIYSFGLFGSGKLIINKNRTFKYHYQGCTKQTFTSGKWIVKNQELVLTSDEKYKHKESCYPKNKPRIDYIDFDKAVFRIINDTLCRIDGNKNSKFVVSKSNR